MPPVASDCLMLLRMYVINFTNFGKPHKIFQVNVCEFLAAEAGK